MKGRNDMIVDHWKYTTGRSVNFISDKLSEYKHKHITERNNASHRKQEIYPILKILQDLRRITMKSLNLIEAEIWMKL